MFLYPLLKYAYDLKFTDEPNYSKIRFDLQNLLMKKRYVPDGKYDWSLEQFEKFKRIDDDDNSSISSCGLAADETVEYNDDISNKIFNMFQLENKYSKFKNKNEPLLSLAKNSRRFAPVSQNLQRRIVNSASSFQQEPVS